MKSKMRIAVLLYAFIAALPGRSAAAEGPAVTVVGWIERVSLGVERVRVKAKLDTGATTSSLHASDLRWSVRDDGDWVAFEVVGEDGKTVHFERKVVRIASIKQRGGRPPQKRPTVIIGVCLGNSYRLTEVNLVDRAGFNYQFLVGRKFLSGLFAVDSALTSTVEPGCGQAGTQ